jgi:hypothetical protein
VKNGSFWVGGQPTFWVGSVQGKKKYFSPDSAKNQKKYFFRVEDFLVEKVETLFSKIQLNTITR